MLNLSNIDLTPVLRTPEEEIRGIKNYIFQLYNELVYKTDEIDKLRDEIEKLKEGGN